MPPAISGAGAVVVDCGYSDPQSSAVNDSGYNTLRKARRPYFTECLLEINTEPIQRQDGSNTR